MIKLFILTILLALDLAACEAEAEPEQKLDFYYDKLEVLNDKGDLFKYNYAIEKIGVDSFKVNSKFEQKVELNNDWKLEISLHQSDNAGDAYKQIIKTPKLGICAIMKSYYRSHFYETLKNHSNAPHYDTCPLPPAEYEVKDYPLSLEKFKEHAKPGYFRIDFNLHKDKAMLISFKFYGHVKKLE